MPTYYFDANALWKFYQKGELGVINARRLVSNSESSVLISPLTSVEFFSVLMRKYRQGSIKKRQVRNIANRFRRDVSTKEFGRRPFKMSVLPESSYRNAESVLLNFAGKSNIGSLDGLHIGIVQSLQSVGYEDIIMVTSDQPMQTVCRRLDIQHYDPEQT